LFNKFDLNNHKNYLSVKVKVVRQCHNSCVKCRAQRWSRAQIHRRS